MSSPCPSLPLPGWIEQFGRVVAEAQASGVPVVASASGALPDVVGDAGLLVPPGDPAALRAALARFLDEPGLWARLRELGLAEVARYSWKSIADTQMALYRAVTSGRLGAGGAGRPLTGSGPAHRPPVPATARRPTPTARRFRPTARRPLPPGYRSPTISAGSMGGPSITSA